MVARVGDTAQVEAKAVFESQWLHEPPCTAIILNHIFQTSQDIMANPKPRMFLFSGKLLTYLH